MSVLQDAGLQKEAREGVAILDDTILSDAELAAVRAFGTACKTTQRLHDYLVEKNYDDSGSSIYKYNVLGVPFVYVVDTSGEIVFDFVEPNYKVRVSAGKLPAAVRGASD